MYCRETESTRSRGPRSFRARILGALMGGAAALLPAAVLGPIAGNGCAAARATHAEAFGNLGPAVNSTADDYAPVLADSATLVFTSTRAPRGESSLKGTARGEAVTRLFFSMRLGSNWDEVQPYALFLDDPGAHCATISFPARRGAFGTIAFLSACDRPDTIGSCDIYGVVQRDRTVMVNLGNEVNGPGWDGQPCVIPDGTRMYFASERPGGFGGTDIWICDALPSGAWGTPRNAGAAVNTAGDELSPFFDAESGRLYFAASTATAGLDLFVVGPDAPARRRLSAPYNSDADDFTPFVLDRVIYLASNRQGGLGGHDLYAFPLAEER